MTDQTTLAAENNSEVSPDTLLQQPDQFLNEDRANQPPSGPNSNPETAKPYDALPKTYTQTDIPVPGNLEPYSQVSDASVSDAPGLRCNRCNKPITPADAIRTPTGYRCKECVRSQQKVFDTTKGLDLPVAFGIAFIISFLASWLSRYLGYLNIFLGTGAGLLIFTVINKILKHRRNAALKWVLAFGTLLGAFPLLLYAIFANTAPFQNVLSNPALMNIIWQGVYTILVTVSTFGQAQV